MKVWVLGMMLAACAASDARSEARNAVLLVEQLTSTVSGARLRLGFEAIPPEGTRAVWTDSTGRWDSIATQAVVTYAAGFLIGGAAGDALQQQQRNNSIKVLRDVAEEDGRLGEVFKRAATKAAVARDLNVVGHFSATHANGGYIRRIVAEPGGWAVAIQRADGVPPVSVSWDDRQLLLAIDMRLYTLGRDELKTVREQHASTMRYVGFPVPQGSDAATYLSAEQGSRAFVEIESALDTMMALALATDLELPKVPRKERATVMVDGRATVFPGRVWKEEPGLTYLVTRDKGLTLVRTAPVPSGS